VAFGHDMGMVDPQAPAWTWWALPYTFGLIALTELLTYLTVGLVSPWGEVAPRRLPLIGGRPIRPLAAIVPATVGGLLVVALGVDMVAGYLGLFGLDHVGFASAWWEALFVAAYAPLVLWGPMLLAVTASYARRRAGERPARERERARAAG
jgi:hypothetical protein